VKHAFVQSWKRYTMSWASPGMKENRGTVRVRVWGKLPISDIHGYGKYPNGEQTRCYKLSTPEDVTEYLRPWKKGDAVFARIENDRAIWERLRVFKANRRKAAR